jgi:SAM-dependent methyltransferase
LQQRRVIDNYNREGAAYDNIRYGRTRGGNFFSEVELPNTLAMMVPGNVLHVGTATGRVSHYLISKGIDYVGIEISHVMAKITKTNLNGIGDIVRGDAEYLPFRNGAFDNVVCVRSFHFLPHPMQFLSQVYNILKPEGRATLSFEKRIPGRHMFEQLRFLPTPGLGRNYYLNSEVFRLVEGAGFEPIFRGNVTRLPLLIYWRLNHDSILRKIHNKIPRWLGTVGVVVGQKSMVRVSTIEFKNRREKPAYCCL